jgi:subtilisin family serine protease
MEHIFKITPEWDGEPISALSVDNILWDFDLLRIPILWSKYGVRGEGVNVHIIDTGVDLAHIAFSHKNVIAKSFIPNESTPIDGNGHGTWCCGKIGANGVGIAPACNVFSSKVLNAEGEGFDSDIVKALNWVNSQPKPHIVNMSLGGEYYNKTQEDLCDALYDKGCIVVAAAGNEDTDVKSYPAAFKNVLAIAAYDRSKSRAYFSNYGEYIAVAAPGVSCYSTFPANNYRRISGTSMASPTVVGLMTLGMSYIFNKKPSINPTTARDLIIASIKTTAIDLGTPGKDNYYGFGGINGEGFMAYIAKNV